MNVKMLVPLSGIGGVALILAALVAAGSTPETNASTRELVSFYAGQQSGQRLSAILLSLGALLFLIFVTGVADVLRRAEGQSGGASTLYVAGSGLLVVGLTILAGLALALGRVAGHASPSTLQALHVLSQEMIFPLVVGTAASMLGAGIAVVQTKVFPTWLGWLAIAVAIVSAIPSHTFGGLLDHVGFVGFLGLCLWTLIISVPLTMSARPIPSSQVFSTSPGT
jgi:hypothetical protein